MARPVKGKTAQQVHEEIRQQNIGWGGGIGLIGLLIVILAKAL